MKDFYIVWEVDRSDRARRESLAIVESVASSLEGRTGDPVEYGEIDRFDPGSAAIAYLIGVGSAMTAQVVMKALEDYEETIEVDLRVDISEGVEGATAEDLDVDAEVVDPGVERGEGSVDVDLDLEAVDGESHRD